MANNRIDIDYDALFQEVMAKPSVLAKAEQRATNIATRARTMAAAEGREPVISVDRVRVATGRAIFNVTSTDVEGEYGATGVDARKTLRRAAGGRRR